MQASQTPAATPTIDTASLNLGSPSTGGGTLGGLMVAFVAALLVIGAGVGYALVRARRRKGD
ncbi:hypothetical protein FDZ74_09800 [bacterium]|nr:MAG: hypothetical protein FDZ74_09800 [bacterium]